MTGTAYGARSGKRGGMFDATMPEILVRKPGGQYVSIVSEEPYASEVAEMISGASTADELPSVEFESYQVVGHGREGPGFREEGTMDEQSAIARLRETLSPGDTVYTVLRHVSRSGMQRAISPIVVRDGEPRDMSYAVGPAVGEKFDQDNGGLKVRGGGMDMGFALVYDLARTLWPEGFECIGERCPSNDHMNGDRDYTPGHVTHRDGGYALRDVWL